MRFSYVFQVFAFSVAALFVAPVQADVGGKFMQYGDYVWGAPSHDETRFYLNEAKIPHNSQWADDEWSPQHWIDARGGSAMAVIEGLYEAEIVLDQYVDGVPVLAVGYPFLTLSGQEQRRVTAFLDHVFKITEGADHGVFNVEYWGQKRFWGLMRDKTDIGYFNKSGLYLQ